jgi:hypothetical protein
MDLVHRSARKTAADGSLRRKYSRVAVRSSAMHDRDGAAGGEV